MNKIDITKWKDDIINSTCELIQIPSIYEESTAQGKPFGEELAKALEYMLELGRKLGFRTKNIDGYCGYIEFGEGEEMLGIIGHLDVVPVGDGWKHKPFGAEIEDGKIYGRGAIDDKGPVIASLYAMKAVMEQKKVNKRVRLILGLNEENDWKCIKYYKEHQELPTVGFSPDADFPCIYAEKGFLTVHLKQNDIQNYNNKNNIGSIQSNDIKILNIDCNSNPINVVPKYCKIDLKINNEQISLISHGIASHAAHPDMGENAISMNLIKLNELLKKHNIKMEILDEFSKLIGMQYDGKNLGINYSDESGTLTLNVGNCSLVENKLDIGLNLRIPITIKIEDIENRFKQISKEHPEIEVEIKDKKQPLHIAKDNELVKILCDTFNEVTKSNSEPIAIGGVTYARAFENCVSFGANMPREKDMCHQADEFIKIDNLIIACQIYAEAIYKLAQ